MAATSGGHPTGDSEQLSKLIGLIYDAAAAPDLWPTFLERLAEALELRAAIFALNHRGEDGVVGEISLATGMDEGTVRAYGERYAHINPFREATEPLPAGAVVASGDMLPDSELVQTEFFNDFYAPAGLRHGVTAVIQNDTDATSAFVGARGPDQSPSGEADLRLVRILTPHLQRARALGERLGTFANDERLAQGVIDQLRVGLLFFGPDGRFASANARGEAILREQDGLGLAGGRLVAGHGRDTNELEAVIKAACEIGERRGHLAPMSLRLQRPSGRRDLEVMACPIDPVSELWGDGRASSFLVVSDGADDFPGAARRMQELHGLSETEATLAVAIASGTTVKEWAAHRGVSVETVRWQLKQVFAKTGTSRQPELMRLVLIGPALIDRERP